MALLNPLRVIVIAPDLSTADAADDAAQSQIGRSRQLRIALLENGYNIVAGLSPDRIRPILDVAMARFEHEQGLRRELASAQTELQDRKTIDRAKAMLMHRQGLSEQVAYDKLRKAAMDKGLRLGEVAQSMLDAADLLG